MLKPAVHRGVADRGRRLGRRLHTPRLVLLATIIFALAGTLAGCSEASSLAGQVLGGADAHALPEGIAEALAQEGDAVVEVDGGEPSFTAEDIAYAEKNEGYESYEPLDALGRCGVAEACVGPETMPDFNEERESISEIHPSGWHSVRYTIVEHESLYNRSHLIGWMLSGENANERNLVTGTRFMNAELMLPFEEEVADYIDHTSNHVLYRVTPVFEGSELVCRAVQMEAYSLEDDGSAISFNVLCKNVQPGIGIDYATGDSWLAEDEGEGAATGPGSNTQGSSGAGASSGASATAAPEAPAGSTYAINTGSHKFHRLDCPSIADIAAHNLDYVSLGRDELLAQGYEPCGACAP